MYKRIYLYIKCITKQEKEAECMHTVENAVIIPLFTLIIIALISVSGYMYDRVTIRNILSQTAIECSKPMTDDERQQLLNRSKKYIEEKTMFVKNISVGISGGSNNTDKLVCSARWPLSIGYFGIRTGNISISQEVRKNKAEELIRKTNIMMNVLKNNA